MSYLGPSIPLSHFGLLQVSEPTTSGSTKNLSNSTDRHESLESNLMTWLLKNCSTKFTPRSVTFLDTALVQYQFLLYFETSFLCVVLAILELQYQFLRWQLINKYVNYLFNKLCMWMCVQCLSVEITQGQLVNFSSAFCVELFTKLLSFGKKS